jgi:hypothetical protein
MQVHAAALADLAEELARLETRRREGGLGLADARRWRALHAELRERLVAGCVNERREAFRVPCTLEVGSETETWEATNFGPGGLAVRGPVHAVGSTVMLDWYRRGSRKCKLGLLARVAWAENQLMGLELKPTIEQQDATLTLYNELLEQFLESAQDRVALKAKTA